MPRKQKYESDIVLGARYRDDQTGIEGVATCMSFFQHACERVTIELIVTGELKEYTFDAPRLTSVATNLRATTERTGGPRPGPTRPSGASR